MSNGTIVKYQVQTGVSTATSSAFVNAMTVPLDTSGDSGNTYYMISYKFNTTYTGMLLKN